MVAILVTTSHRGVFFGYVPEDCDRSQRSLTLFKCRNVIYWSGTKGFLGLASRGPENGSRIGAEAQECLLHDITSVNVCTEEAAKKFAETQ